MINLCPQIIQIELWFIHQKIKMWDKLPDMKEFENEISTLYETKFFL